MWTIHDNCTDRVHGFRLLTPLNCEASSVVDVLLVLGGDFHSGSKERSGTSRTSIDLSDSQASRTESPSSGVTNESAS